VRRDSPERLSQNAEIAGGSHGPPASGTPSSKMTGDRVLAHCEHAVGLDFTGRGGAEPGRSGRRPWKGCRARKRSPEEPPGVWGVERLEGGGGNWGGPPRPGDAAERIVGATRPITGQSGKWVWCRVGVGGGRSTDRADGTTEPAVMGRAAASFMR
jgi:hypothetical protein